MKDIEGGKQDYRLCRKFVYDRKLVLLLVTGDWPFLSILLYNYYIILYEQRILRNIYRVKESVFFECIIIRVITFEKRKTRLERVKNVILLYMFRVNLNLFVKFTARFKLNSYRYLKIEDFSKLGTWF